MSMNLYMHPRNIYKEPPNFKQLAIEYPEFRKHATQDLSGKVTLNFKNVEAMRALTCTLLKKDFGLDIEIPINKLIPTIPLRLNYILWIEDLLSLTDHPLDIKGIDIGTGASCVYPTIAAKKNKWSMIATETDVESVKYATENVKRNCLENFIKILQVQNDTLLLKDALENFPDNYNFCMCNPPFFSTTEELHPFFKARKQNRPHPRNAFCASVDEVVAKGGEVEYIGRLINESKTIGTQIKIYTTMVGHKYNLPVLKKHLREIEVTSFKQTEFCQGHTTRWGLAWTFQDIDLTKVPDSLVAAKKKVPKPLYYEIPRTDNIPYKINIVAERLTKIFNDLQFEYQEIKHISNLIEYIITAYGNTWSHQRRQRRQKTRLDSSNEETNSFTNENPGLHLDSDIHKTCDKMAELSCKRTRDDDGFYNAKKLKTNLTECSSYLKAKISIMKVETSIGLELMFFEGTGTKEALHQVLQYIKNSLMKEEL